MDRTDLDASADYHFATADPLTKRAHVKRRATVFLDGPETEQSEHPT